MQQLWRRNIALTLGVKDTDEAVKITDLRIIFQVEKNSESNPNTAKISVYNISPETRSIAEKEGAVALLEVGYQDNLEQLFYGDITKSYISRQGSDWVTTVECGDGDQALRSTHIDKSYAPGTDLKTVIADTVKSFKDQGQVIIGSLLGVKSEKAQNGLAATGSSKDILDKLAEKMGLEWSVQDNILQVVPKDSDLGDDAVLLTPETGLIGTPVIREKEGIEFTALIQTTRFMPGRLVTIQSSLVNGSYKIKSVNFAGDSHGPAFYATGQGEPI